MGLPQPGVLYPVGQGFPQGGGFKFQHNPLPAPPPSRPPRLYSPGNSHPHTWHPYSRGPPLNSAGMRRQ